MGDGLLGREFDTAGKSLEDPFFDGFGLLEAPFELEAGRSSCGGRDPAKCKGNDSGVEVADGEVVVVLDAAVPKGAPQAWIGNLGLPDKDWGI